MRKLVILMAFLFIMLFFTSCTQSLTTDIPITTTSATTPVSIGDMAPDFTLEDLEGNLFTLSDFLGSPVVINFWLINCHHCIEEFPYFEDFYRNRPALMVFITINRGDSLSALIEFVGENEYSFPILMDIRRSVSLDYGISSIPVTLFIDKYGVIQVKKIGAYHSIAEIESDFASIT